MITEDNFVINIDTVIYFQVTDPKSATYDQAYPGRVQLSPATWPALLPGVSHQMPVIRTRRFPRRDGAR